MSDLLYQLSSESVHTSKKLEKGSSFYKKSMNSHYELEISENSDIKSDYFQRKNSTPPDPHLRRFHNDSYRDLDDSANQVICNRNIEHVINDSKSLCPNINTKSLDLAKSAVNLREITKKLVNTNIKFINSGKIMIVTKLGEDYLVGLTRDIVVYLLTHAFSNSKIRITIYVESAILNSKKFNLSRIYQKYHDTIGRVKEWTPELCIKNPQIFDFVITLGGDGTLLYTSWLFQNVVPVIIPFKLGSLGFLTNFDIKNARQILKSAINHGSNVSLRMRFKVTVYRVSKKKSTAPQKVPHRSIDHDEIVGSFKKLTVFGPNKPGPIRRIINDKPNDYIYTNKNKSILSQDNSSSSLAKMINNQNIAPSQSLFTNIMPKVSNTTSNTSDNSSPEPHQISTSSITKELKTPTPIAGLAPINILPKNKINIDHEMPNPELIPINRNDYFHSSELSSDTNKRHISDNRRRKHRKNSRSGSISAHSKPTGATTPLSLITSTPYQEEYLNSTNHLSQRPITPHTSSAYPSSLISPITRSKSIRSNSNLASSASTSLLRTGSISKKSPISRSNSINLKKNHSNTSLSSNYSSRFTWDEHESFHVLNEVVVDRGPNPFLSVLELYANEQHLTSVQADGIVISTPTGSTAYSLSAGGSLVHPDIPAMLITPICPHTLSFRPMLLPEATDLKIEVPLDSRNTAWVSFDGRNRLELNRGDYIKVSPSNFPVPSMNHPDCNKGNEWFENLTQSFNWNTRMRQKQMGILINDDGTEVLGTGLNEDDLADDES
ncbi:putative kinase [Smittium culicis]|uniref:Putative kinase n=1 Tax=Smittium culicis TaxID=133412 RepID=A0A1R1XG75_9FUNG|nr:putative kinase [Smittium culicis]